MNRSSIFIAIVLILSLAAATFFAVKYFLLQEYVNAVEQDSNNTLLVPYLLEGVRNETRNLDEDARYSTLDVIRRTGNRYVRCGRSRKKYDARIVKGVEASISEFP